jgi:hypothetical protein
MVKNRDEVQLAYRLKDHGCPLDLQFFQQAENGRSRSLRIRQVGGLAESRVFDLETSGAGCMLDLEIVNDLGRGIYLRGFELELPWQDDLFSWLPDPRERGKKPELYRFAGDHLEYERKIVINRLVPSFTKFRKGDLVAGLVLGQGPREIPDGYKHGEELHAKFSVIDQFDTPHSADVVLYIDRGARLLRPRRPKKARRSLFTQSRPVGEGATVAEYGELSHSTEERLQTSRMRESSLVGSSAVDSRK